MTDGDLWQRFTNPATKIVQFAQEEARRAGVLVVGTEHLLLGCLREGEGLAARVLERLGVSLGRLHAECTSQFGTFESLPLGTERVTLSPQAKTALENALTEARDLNPRLGLREYVDTEHLLLGLLRDSGDNHAVSLLMSLGVSVACVREEVMQCLNMPSQQAASDQIGSENPPFPPVPPTDSPIGLTGKTMADGEMGQRFTNPATRVIHYAQEETKRLGMNVVGTEHILLGLVREDEGVAARVLERLGVSLGRIRSELNSQVDASEGHAVGSTRLTLSPKAKKALEYALAEARELNPKLGLLDFVDTEHLLLGLVREGASSGSKAVRLLEGLGVDLERVRKEVMQYLGGSATTAPITRQRSSTPVLDAFGRDLTKMAGEHALDPVIGREKEFQRVMQILTRRTKNNPLLIGDPGVGKTAIVEGLAQRVFQKDVPEVLFDKRLVALDLAALVAGAKNRGEFEERMKRVTDEIRQSAGEIILFVDELHTVVGTGVAEGTVDASIILKPALSRGELQCIVATTLNEFKKDIEKDPALERYFQPVHVNEPSVDESISILRGLRGRYEDYHQVKITDDALALAARLADRYITDRFLPDKAIGVMDEAAARVRLEASMVPPDLRTVRQDLEQITQELQEVLNVSPYERDYDHGFELRDKQRELRERAQELEEQWKCVRDNARTVVEEDDIAEVVSIWTGIPVCELTTDESTRLLTMEEHRHQRVIGQDEASNAVARAVRLLEGLGVDLECVRKEVLQYLGGTSMETPIIEEPQFGAYEESIAYQDALAAAKRVYILSKRFPAVEHDALTHDLRRASRHLCLCVAQMWGQRADVIEVRKTLTTAKLRVIEIRTLVDCAIGCGYLDSPTGDELKILYDELLVKLAPFY